MKLLHTADLHLGMTNYSKFDPETGLEGRLLDFFKTFDFVVETAIADNVDAFIFAGDAYKSRDPSPTQQRGFGEKIRKLTKAGIPVILVVGNHDTPTAFGKANTLDIYSALEIENVWVSRELELLKIPTKSGLLQVIAFPWTHKSDLKKTGKKLLSLYEKISNPPAGGPAILVGHLEVEGASYGSEKGLTIRDDTTIPLSLLRSKKISYVALGHIHKHQELSRPPASGPPIIYCGSLERIDFGEEKEEKGFVLVKINKKGLVTHQFIPSKAREFLTIAVDLKEKDLNPTQTILAEMGKYSVKDKIVRVLISIPAGQDQEIEMDKIKKALSSSYCIASIAKNIAHTERIKLGGEEEVERLTPLEALRKYFETKKYNLERIKELEKYAALLIE